MLKVNIKIDSPGADTGPTFDLYSDSDSYSSPFATNVAKPSLVSGYIANNVPDGTSNVKVIPSPGNGSLCSTNVYIPISTTTSTTTTTTHPPLVNAGRIYNNSPNTISASYLQLYFNYVSLAYVNLPPLAPGSFYDFSTSYTNSTNAGQFKVIFYNATTGISGLNKFHMDYGGVPSIDVALYNAGYGWEATSISTSVQYAIRIIFH